MYKIVADSSCELKTVTKVPSIIYNEDVTYVDDGTMDITDMLDRFASYKGRTYSACSGGTAWTDAFEGSDEIYAITLTSSLSGIYNAALSAAEMYKQEHPEVKIHVFDSLSVGPSMVLMAEKIQELKNQEMEFEEVVKQVTNYQKNLRLFFTLESLHNLAQNGRVNKVIASAIGALGIRIMATASKAGVIEAIGKCRGDKKTVAVLMKQLQDCACSGKKIRISHVENENLALMMARAMRVAYPEADIAIRPASGAISYYGERGAVLVACEGSWPE